MTTVEPEKTANILTGLFQDFHSLWWVCYRSMLEAAYTAFIPDNIKGGLPNYYELANAQFHICGTLPRVLPDAVNPTAIGSITFRVQNGRAAPDRRTFEELHFPFAQGNESFKYQRTA
ncbi:hypothetical protein VFPPC_14772 [Pochonia chlamydosporia 170]|uniref:Uncharacterized protein n=1 Tax=Pochonia chlamydosporia 170 TaxID=1380566 RepID=A0A179F1Y4_METCM|nr:hypothetical protein VFPPC_14772 [Pochonia chlamydosporia 170]OAQ59442.1 hypothetical protein VFPPC_14772 [Pochonia chlamydosporia 170]